MPQKLSPLEGMFVGSLQPDFGANLTEFLMVSHRISWMRLPSAAACFPLREKKKLSSVELIVFSRSGWVTGKVGLSHLGGQRNHFGRLTEDHGKTEWRYSQADLAMFSQEPQTGKGITR